MEMDCGEMIDLTGLNDSDTMTDAELAERLQMEELETMNQSDFEVARHLQEMERRHAASSHMIPDLFMFGEPMRRMNSGYHRAESRRLRPPRPLPPRPTRVTRTSNSDEHDTDSNEPLPPSTDNNPKDDDDVTSHNDHQTTAAAAAASAPPSRSSMARRAQLAMNRNRGDPSACTDGTSTEPDHMEDAVNQRDPASATAAAQDTRAIRMDRLFGAMNRNRRSHPSVFLPPPDFPATDDEQSRGTVCQTRSRSMRDAPPLPTAHRPNNAEESRDALNHNHSNPTTSTAPSTDDAVGDAEQQDDRGVIPPPPVPPRRQRRPPRNRRMFGGSVSGHGLVPFALHHADYHDTLGLPGWAPVRRHYEFSRLLDNDDGSGNNYEALWALSEQIGDAANKGLNLIQITRLPTMKYKASSSSLSSSTVTSDDMMTCDDAVSSSSSSESMSDATLASMETVCRVCLCGFENGEVLRSLPCCHRFHVDCIDQWIKQNAICPVCRDNIKDHLNGGGRGGGGAGGGGDQWDQYQ